MSLPPPGRRPTAARSCCRSRRSRDRPTCLRRSSPEGAGPACTGRRPRARSRWCPRRPPSRSRRRCRRCRPVCRRCRCRSRRPPRRARQSATICRSPSMPPSPWVPSCSGVPTAEAAEHPPKLGTLARTRQCGLRVAGWSRGPRFGAAPSEGRADQPPSTRRALPFVAAAASLPTYAIRFATWVRSVAGRDRRRPWLIDARARQAQGRLLTPDLAAGPHFAGIGSSRNAVSRVQPGGSARGELVGDYEGGAGSGVTASPWWAPSARRVRSIIAWCENTKRERKRKITFFTWPRSVMVTLVPPASGASS